MRYNNFISRKIFNFNQCELIIISCYKKFTFIKLYTKTLYLNARGESRVYV